MRTFLRWISSIVMLVMLVSPVIPSAAAEPAATPVVESSPESSPAVVPTMEASPESKPAIAPSSNSGVLSIAGTYSVLPSFDVATNTLTISVTFDDGFSAATGDSLVVTYGWSLAVFPSSQATLTNVPQAAVTLDTDSQTITITFTDDFAAAGLAVTGAIDFPGEVYWLQCVPRVETYTPYGDIYFFLPPSNSYFQVDLVAEEPCLGITAPTIDWMDYDADRNELEISVLFPGPNAAGQQVTLTYPADKMVVSPGPVTVMRYSNALDREVPVGTATASNGLITVTFFDTGLGDVEWEEYAEFDMVAWLTSGTCADTGELVVIDIGELEFVSNSGDEFTEYVESVLCNAAPMTKSGALGTDSNGDPIITWTVDTGDVLGGAVFEDYLEDDSMWFMCDELEPQLEVISGSFTWENDLCESWGIRLILNPEAESDDPVVVRAKITFVTSLNPEVDRTSYLNCARVYAMYDRELDRAAASGSNGVGGQACYEVFLADGGDFITKSVDKDVANPGDVLTYTVTASTTSDSWSQINITDVIPVGFEIDPSSITCTIEPAIFAADPCFTLVDGRLTATAVRYFDESDEGFGWHSDPVSMTVTFSGMVTALPGASITNEACSERSMAPNRGEGPEFAATMGDPTIPGGGVICASAVTSIPGPTPTATLPPTVVPSPTATLPPTVAPSPTATIVPTQTPDPATPTETAVSTPATVQPVPTETASAVTGLPETGSGMGTASVMISLVALTGMLLAFLIGLRLRSTRVR